MNSRSILASLGLTVLAATASADGVAYARAKSPSPIEGAWVVRTSPYNCQTGVVFPFTIVSYITFGARGVLSETNSSPSFQPGQRSSGHGYWERTGTDSYRAVFQAFIQFTSVVSPPALPQYTRGSHRFEHDVVMSDNDHWSSTALVSFYDEGSAPLGNGCAVATAERLR
jgi:hypothetical protein